MNIIILKMSMNRYFYIVEINWISKGVKIKWIVMNAVTGNGIFGVGKDTNE